MIGTALVVLAMLFPILPAVGLLALAEWWDRRRAAVIARQIRLTDAIAEELGLGAVVAPLVSRPLGRPWRVSMQLPVDRAALAGRVLAITHRTLSGMGAARYEVILTPAVPALETVTILRSARRLRVA
jgi:hypothetical protein